MLQLAIGCYFAIAKNRLRLHVTYRAHLLNDGFSKSLVLRPELCANINAHSSVREVVHNVLVEGNIAFGKVTEG